MNAPSSQNLASRLDLLTDKQRILLHRRLGLDDPNPHATPADPTHGRLASFLILHDGHEMPPVGELRKFLTDRLPEFMVPSIFQPIDALPLTPNGKVDRKALASLEAAPRISASSPATAPANPSLGETLEITLLEIWRKALGNPTITPEDDFFEAGGDSILAIQMIAQAAQAGITVSLTEFFQNPTVSGMAARLKTEKRVATEPLDPPRPAHAAVLALSPIQHWFFEQGLGAYDRWNQTRYLPLPSGLEMDQLIRVIQAVLELHPALRSAYLKRPAGWVQKLRPTPDSPSIEVVDFTDQNDADRAEQLDRMLLDLNRSIDFASGSLIRCACIRNTAPGKDDLVLTVHHLAVDGISWSILLDDLTTASRQLASGEPIRLHPPTSDPGAWIGHLHDRADTAAVTAEADYWTSQPWNQVRKLPIDLSGNGANTEGSTEVIRRRLSISETRALLESASTSHRADINEILISALTRAVAEWTGVSSVLIGIEGHGREPFEGSPDVSRTVGWFTSFFPVLMDLQDKDKTTGVINGVKGQLRKIPQKGLGFGLLKYLTSVPQLSDAIGRIPGPEIIFNYLGNDRSDPAESSDLFSVDALSRHSRSSDAPRAGVLECNTWISGNRLEIALSYSKNLHRRETADHLADSMVQFLTQASEEPAEGETEAIHPAEFPDADLDQEDLNRLLDRFD